MIEAVIQYCNRNNIQLVLEGIERQVDLEMAKRPELTFLFAMRATGGPVEKSWQRGQRRSGATRQETRCHGSLLTAAEKSRDSC